MKNFLKISAIALIALFSSHAQAAPYKEIAADDLVKMKQENKELVVIDSRSGDWFDGVVIDGATQLATSDTNEESLAKLAPNKSQAVVFYCTNEQCPASAKAAHKAAEIGYNNLYKYPGGIEDWKKRGLPTITVAKQ